MCLLDFLIPLVCFLRSSFTDLPLVLIPLWSPFFACAEYLHVGFFLFVHDANLFLPCIIKFKRTHSDVCTKYQEASKIVNLALQGLVSQCIPGAKIIDLCEFGHTVMEAQAAKLYTKKVDGKQIDRGVAFPVCISVNDVVCNHSPLPTEERVSHTQAPDT